MNPAVSVASSADTTLRTRTSTGPGAPGNVYSLNTFVDPTLIYNGPTISLTWPTICAVERVWMASRRLCAMECYAKRVRWRSERVIR